MKKIILFATALLMSASMFAEAPKVDDQFTDEGSGLKFKVTAVGQTNTVKVIPNDYSKDSYTVPDKVTYNSVSFAVTEIGNSAFRECYLESITLPEGLTTIGTYAFYFCSFTSITIPTTVTTIGDFAFQNCGYLQSITIPESVTTLGDLAFDGCSAVKTVTFLGNACQKAIGEEVFASVGTKVTPALLVLPSNWEGKLPDQDGKWYEGYFKLSYAALPTLPYEGKVRKGSVKVIENGHFRIIRNDKRYTIMGVEE